MNQIGLVTKKDKNLVTVFVRRYSSCGENCAHCGNSCEVPGIDINIETDVPVEIGDYVELETENRTILKYSFLLYGIPMTLFVLGIVLGISLFQKEVIGFLFGIGSLGISFFLLKWLDVKFFKNKRNTLKIIGIKK